MFGNLKEFPKPFGSFVVGVTQMDFLDEGRKGVFDFAKDELRKIPARIYYPADSNENKEHESYVTKEEAIAAKKGSLGLISIDSLNIKTHCFTDVKISSKQKNYPVIFFNHGYFSYSSQNTVLCSDLASCGYIVVSLGHPYESSAVRYKDGKVIEANKELFNEFKKTMSKDNKEKFKNLLKNVYSDAEVVSASEAFYENFKGTTVWNNIKIWADDTRFVADELYKLNDGKIPSMFEGRLNLELGFGITGHSYGGCTAAQVCLEDERFKCGINLDAPTYGEYRDKDIKKPFMVLGSYLIENCSRTIYLNNSEDSYAFIINKTEHMDFTDYVFFAHQTRFLGLLGKSNMYLVRDVISNYHIDFFDKYLCCDDKVDLKKHKFTEVKSRIKYKSVD
ncbi:hypothetical protein JHL18_09125 [Clostridium sp. YIM B02505]|uniref:Platelet-activating factor acetylhydrolase n=1 Tax=Clostridium yunnanense TaxID=2800325 RepID=A0ABS1EN53_9CLOT|nr:hypothetical protein [Clostridium yunnanense]MBK1810797.1 hypothetical protein [Clostridium yunnanense]